MSDKESQSDPVFASSLRELRWIVLIWLVNFCWVVGYCRVYGYQAEGQPLATVLGMPSWVFWGILFPWLAATAVTSWFALTQIEDHTLEAPPSSESKGKRCDG